MTKRLKTRHIQRVQAGRCTLELGFIFNDCLNNLERVADHCSNIAVAILEASDPTLLGHDYLKTLNHSGQKSFREQVEQCAKKYYAALDSLEQI